MTDVERMYVSVSGRVQGVFFRAALREEARRRGVTGWVRNTRDGRVEAELQGASDAVEALIDVCRQGPPAAEVRALDVERRAVVKGESAFIVRHW